MKAVVTGASGHAGANLVRALADGGHHVRALVRSDTRALEGLEIEHAPGDLFASDALRRSFAAADVVFHLAGAVSIAGDPDGEVMRTNVEGTRRVIEACLGAGVRRLVHFSTVHALCHRERGFVDERRPLASEGSVYDLSKATAEHLVLEAVREQGLDAVIVSPTGIIGPHDHKPSPMGRTLRRIFAGRMPVVLEGGFDFVDARDVAAGAIAAAERGRRGERYIFAGHFRSLRNLARLASELASRRPPVVLPSWTARASAPLAERAARSLGREPILTRESLDVIASDRRYDSTRARDELGFRPRPFRRTIHDTHEWFRASGRDLGARPEG